MRIDLVPGLDHVVLLVALEPVLRTEGGGHIDPAVDQRVERMREARGYRGRMRDQRDPAPFQRLAQLLFRDEPIDAEFHGALAAPSRAVKQDGSWKSGASLP